MRPVSRDSSLINTEPRGVRARVPRRKYPPHPPFGHLLPGGEKGTALALAVREQSVALAPPG